MPNAPSFAVITGAENVKQEGLQPIELSYSEGHRYKTYHLCWLRLILGEETNSKDKLHLKQTNPK